MEPWTHRSSSDDLEVSHHTHIFVLQVVAMENVASAITRKSNQDVRGLSGAEVDGVFPTLIVGTRPATVSQDLEVNQIKTQGMVEIRLQPPDFRSVQLGPRIHAGRIERVAVYPPAMAATPIAEIENASDHRIVGVRERNIAELRRKITLVALTADHVESHDLAGGSVSCPVHQRHRRSNRTF